MANLQFNADNKSNLASYTTAGQVIFTEDNLYLVKTDGSKIKYSSIEVVPSLPVSNISSDKIYILSTNFSLNYYDSSWHILSGNQIIPSTTSPTDTTKLWLDINTPTNPILKWSNGTSWVNVNNQRNFTTNPINLTSEVTGVLSITNVNTGTLAKTTDLNNYLDKSTYQSKIDGIITTGDGTKYKTDDGTYKAITGSNATSINSHTVDNSTYSPNRVLMADNSGNYTHANVNVAGLVATNGTILQPSGSPVSIASGEEKTFSYPSCLADKMLINIQEQIAGSSITDNHLDFSDSSKYNVQDSGKILFNSNKAQLDIYTKMLMHMDDANFTDEFSHTITNNGVTLDTTNKVFGTGSAYFNGSSYLSIPVDNSIELSSGDFTIDFKFYQKARSSWDTIFSVNPTSTAYYTPLYLYAGSSGIGLLCGNNSSWIVNISSSTLLTLNTWYHFAIVRYGSKFSVYLNGVEIMNSTYSGSLKTFTNNYIIGKQTSDYINGYIDEFRISKGIARWTSNFTPPIQSYSKAYSVINTPIYLKTTGTSNFSLTSIDTFTSLAMPVTLPTNTSVKIFTSFDNGTNWLYHDGTGWHKFTGDITQNWTSSNSNTDLQTYFNNLSMTTLKSDLSSLSINPISLDFMWQLNTTDLTVTPTVSPVTLTYLSLPHNEFASYGRYNENVTFGVKIIRDPLDNTKTNQIAIKNLSNVSRVANPNVIVTTS